MRFSKKYGARDWMEMRRQYEMGRSLSHVADEWMIDEATLRGYIVKAGGHLKEWGSKKIIERRTVNRVLELADDGRSIKEIAKKLDMPESTVKDMLNLHSKSVSRSMSKSTKKKVVAYHRRTNSIKKTANKFSATSETIRELVADKNYFTGKLLGKTKKFTVAQAAYIAGLIDGEGCITCPRGKNDATLRANLAITNCNPAMMNWIAKTIGAGFIHAYKAKPVEWYIRRKLKIPRVSSVKTRYMWVGGLSIAHDVLRQALPYLVTKHKRAELAIELCHIRRGSGGGVVNNPERQLEIFNAIRQMNQLGYEKRELVKAGPMREKN